MQKLFLLISFLEMHNSKIKPQTLRMSIGLGLGMVKMNC
jgi:hypothetical protein